MYRDRINSIDLKQTEDFSTGTTTPVSHSNDRGLRNNAEEMSPKTNGGNSARSGSALSNRQFFGDSVKMETPRKVSSSQGIRRHHSESKSNSGKSSRFQMKKNDKPMTVKSKNKKITKTHPQFELSYDMMLGIRHTVGQTESKPTRELKSEDFKERVKLRFPSKGSPLTPAHQMHDFKFKDYCPEVFRRIRGYFGINPADYLMCVCGDFPHLEFISNSKSGAFFFYSHDRQYMIKTISGDECKFLMKILENYYIHLLSNPNSLLTRFLGLHRVKPHKRKQKHFLIMGSVFYTRRIMHLTFDIKGSLHGRRAKDKDKGKDSCVYKDKDFLRMNTRIQIGPERAKLLNEQLSKDADFLQNLKIMDYSLLLGIHDTRRPGPMIQEITALGTHIRRHVREHSLTSVRESRSRSNEENADEDHNEVDVSQVRDSLEPRQHGFPKNYNLVTSPAEHEFVAPEFQDEVDSKLSMSVMTPSKTEGDRSEARSIFFDDDGGMAGEVDGIPNGVFYYMGIIDILIQYRLKKKMESKIKSLHYKLSRLSACPPSLYASRFKKFLADAIS